MKSIKQNQTVFGYPSMEKNQFLKSYIIFKKLPKIEERIKKLESVLNNK